MTSTEKIISNIEKQLKSLDIKLGKIPNNVSNVKERNALKDKIQAKEVELAREKQVLSHEKKQSAGKKVKSLSMRGRSGGAGGRMMMPQEYSKRSLYKPKTN